MKEKQSIKIILKNLVPVACKLSPVTASSCACKNFMEQKVSQLKQVKTCINECNF